MRSKRQKAGHPLGLRRQKRSALLLISFSFFSLLLSCRSSPSAPSAGEPAVDSLQDNFNGSKIDETRWVLVRDGDFRKEAIELSGARLKISADTIGTDERTIKYLGLRSRSPVDFRSPKLLSCNIDWNNQSNGTYLTASIYICPQASAGAPEKEPDWLKFEYAGVPPDKNARALVAAKVAGQLKLLETEGWPEQRQGRLIGNQRIEIRLAQNNLTVSEDGRRIVSTNPQLGFSSGYVYLLLSSHSNYPERTVFFDNFSITASN